MSELSKRCLVTAILLILTAATIFFYQDKGQADIEKAEVFRIPLEIGEWKSEEISVENKILQILETDSVLMRRYTNIAGDSVLLTIVYYQNNRVEFHLPERCSVGQGSYIVQQGKESIHFGDVGSNIIANKLVVRSEKVNQAILYYFQKVTTKRLS